MAGRMRDVISMSQFFGGSMTCPICSVFLRLGDLIQKYPLFSLFRCPRCKRTVLVENHPERRTRNDLQSISHEGGSFRGYDVRGYLDGFPPLHRHKDRKSTR